MAFTVFHRVDEDIGLSVSACSSIFGEAGYQIPQNANVAARRVAKKQEKLTPNRAEIIFGGKPLQLLSRGQLV